MWTCVGVIICCECNTGELSFEIKTEADSNDITVCSYDVKPSTGMFGFFGAILSAFHLSPYAVSM